MAQAEGPAAKRRKLDFSEDVKLLVGEHERPFTSHKDVLCSFSTFFRAALNGEFREAYERIIRLPEIEPETFSAYLQWAYSGEIVIAHAEEAAMSAFGRHRQRDGLVKLYITGDQLGDTLLRNKIIDKLEVLHQTFSLNFCSPSINLAYARLPKSAKLRSYILYTYRACPGRDSLSVMRKELHRDFLIDLVLFLKTPDGQQSRSRPTCAFHDHDADVPICVDSQ